MVRFATIAALMALASASPAAALLTGKQVSVTRLFPDVDTATAGPLITTAVTDPPLLFSPFLSQFLYQVSFTDTTITISSPFVDGNGTIGPPAATPFNGFRVSDVFGTIDNFNASVGAGTTVGGFGASNLSFTNDDIFINFIGIDGFTDGASTIVIELSARGVIPEPATWAMLITGFGAAGLVLRRRAMSETRAA
jgi:hypothetical protein